MELIAMRETYAIAKLEPDAPVPAWVLAPGAGRFVSVSRTPEELSIVCSSTLVPGEWDAAVESDWRAFRVKGALDFGLTGVLASLASPLASAGVSIFATSTYDTDYVLVKRDRYAEAIESLERAGHRIEEEKGE